MYLCLTGRLTEEPILYEVNAIIPLAAFKPNSLFRFGFKMEGSEEAYFYTPCLWVIFRHAYKSPSRYNNIISLVLRHT